MHRCCVIEDAARSQNEPGIHALGLMADARARHSTFTQAAAKRHFSSPAWLPDYPRGPPFPAPANKSVLCIG